MNRRLFARSLALQFVLTVVAAAISFTVWGWDTALAVAVAGAISSLDLWAMGWAVTRLASARTHSRLFYTMVLGLKFPVLILVVYLLVVVLALNAVGLIVGFSTLVVAILYASLSFQKMLVEGKES
jgi:F0F1-type ATP synthase assembly protein I